MTEYLAQHPAHETLPEGEDFSILERHPDWPRLNVTFYFGSHSTKKDSEGAAPHLKEADIYLMEHMAADAAKQRAFLQARVADAQITPAALLRLTYVPFMKPIIKELKGTRKAVGVIDLPGGAQELMDELDVAMSQAIPVDDSFEKSVGHLDEIIARRSELQEQREQLMIRAFEDEIERILEERPELKDKPELNVLITMGAAHTRLRHSLAKAGVASERYFSAGSTVTYNHSTEAMRTYAYGYEPSQELLEKAWVEDAISKVISRTVKKYKGTGNAMNHYERTLVDQFTHEQREALYEIVNETRDFSNKTIEKIDTYLQENQLGKLPRSGEEIDPASRSNRGSALARRAISTFARKK